MTQTLTPYSHALRRSFDDPISQDKFRMFFYKVSIRGPGSGPKPETLNPCPSKKSLFGVQAQGIELGFRL